VEKGRWGKTKKFVDQKSSPGVTEFTENLRIEPIRVVDFTRFSWRRWKQTVSRVK
jgi:hypothetical protein